MTLDRFFRENPRTAVAFSGGVDSAYLLYMASIYGNQVKAYYVKTAFQPEFEYTDAEQLAKELGVDMAVVNEDILCAENIVSNPSNRCYHCKKRIFKAIAAAADADGFSLIIDGTNASDDASDRPGMRALEEMAVRSPLRECGLTKDMIRQKSKEAGLFTWDKPAYACLATRIPTGERITAEKLHRTERAECFLYHLGLRDFRVRTIENVAKIQVRESDLPVVLANRQQIIEEFRQYYQDVLLDLEVRNGQ